MLISLLSIYFGTPKPYSRPLNNHYPEIARALLEGSVCANICQYLNQYLSIVGSICTVPTHGTAYVPTICK